MMRKSTHRFAAHMSTVHAEALQDVEEIINTPQTNAVAAALVKSQAFRVDLRLLPQQWFRWKCGIAAPCGCDCRTVNGFPAIRHLIDRILAKAVRSTFPDAEYIVGVANAGIPWARMLADRLHLPLAYVRTPKTMGKGHLVECAPKGGQRALVIEDIVVSGKSTINAIHAIHRETDLKVCGVQSLVNWNFPSMRFHLDGYIVRTLTSYPMVISCALREGMINEKGYAQLMAFYKDPYLHPWAQYYQDLTPLQAYVPHTQENEQ
jgi:orotate phosphoribosyltransferase